MSGSPEARGEQSSCVCFHFHFQSLVYPPQVLDDTFGAAWDPFCAAAQPAGAAWRCFHAQYWPPATTVGAVPSLFLEYLYDMANVCASAFDEFDGFTMPILWVAMFQDCVYLFKEAIVLRNSQVRDLQPVRIIRPLFRVRVLCLLGPHPDTGTC